MLSCGRLLRGLLGIRRRVSRLLLGGFRRLLLSSGRGRRRSVGSDEILVDFHGILHSLDSGCVTLGYLRAHIREALAEFAWRYIVVNLGRFGVSLETMA